jgi:PPOX class probable F420-dependent enzyme
MLDTSTEAGKRAEQRLREEEVIWLTTVNRSGQPQSSPVWFLWDGQTFLIYSRPNQKTVNVERHPRVSLHLNDHHGGDVVTIEGTAELQRNAPPATENAAYLEKYREGVRRIGMDPANFAASYSDALRITPTRMRVG